MTHEYQQLPDLAIDRLVLVAAGGRAAVAFGLIKKGVRHLEVFDKDQQRAHRPSREADRGL